MRVLFDTSSVYITKSGVSSYTTALIGALKEIDRPVSVVETAFKPRFSRTSKLRMIDSLWRDAVWPMLALPNKSRKVSADIIHCPAFNFPAFTKRNLLITVHDIYALVKPGDFKFWHQFITSTYIARAVNSGRHILVLSEFTKQEIFRYFPKARGENIHVVHSAVPDTRFVSTDPVLHRKTKEKFNIERPYILSVSTIEPRKNFYSLIKAFETIAHKIDHSLVLVGQNGWNNKDVYTLIQELNLEDRIKFTGFVMDDELNSLYTDASCFVFPSFYEGFGFTPLEAMKCGSPVVSSNASCMPEVLGDAALYFDPNSIEDMAHAMYTMIFDSQLAKEYTVKGKLQADKYSWEKTANATYDIYKNIVDEKNNY
jgi:glycosyltransferase involved in cell wall biosynthesis